MLRLPPLKILLLIIACLAPQKIWPEQVDTASIRKILVRENRPHPDPENLPHSDPMDDEISKKVLDRIADSETMRLGQNNENWNVSSPKWKPVYDRVHADLESELPNTGISPLARALKTQQDYEDDLASHLSQSDVDSILTYYSTPEGQRYQDFIQRINKIITFSRVRSSQDAQSTAAKLTPEQTKQYARMLMLSHLAEFVMARVQIAQATGGDTSGSTVLRIFMVEAINKSPRELEVLNRDYGNDLSGFEAFSGTEAARHFFVSMEQAWSHVLQNGPFSASIKAVAQKHASEWKALYLAQTGDPPSDEILSKSENPTPAVEPPRGQAAIPQKLRISSAVAERNLLHEVEPEYPQEAKIFHLEGDVVLQGVISKEGDVAEVRLVSGLGMLAKAAMDAVKQWRYKPYLLNGDPVEVETTIVVRFSHVSADAIQIGPPMAP